MTEADVDSLVLFVTHTLWVVAMGHTLARVAASEVVAPLAGVVCGSVPLWTAVQFGWKGAIVLPAVFWVAAAISCICLAGLIQDFWGVPGMVIDRELERRYPLPTGLLRLTAWASLRPFRLPGATWARIGKEE